MCVAFVRLANTSCGRSVGRSVDDDAQQAEATTQGAHWRHHTRLLPPIPQAKGSEVAAGRERSVTRMARTTASHGSPARPAETSNDSEERGAAATKAGGQSTRVR